MHSILRRLMYYGVGLGIGLVLVFAMFGTRGCSWLPENRIKSSIFSQVLVLDTNDLRVRLNNETYIQLLSDGSVNLSLSMRKGEPKAYYFENSKSRNSTEYFQVVFETDAVVSILKPINENQKAKAHINDYWLPIIHVPGDSNFISFSEDLKNQVQLMGLSRNEIHTALGSNGFARTVAQEYDPDKRKIHDFRFRFNEINYKFKARVYKSALEIMYLEEEGE